MTWHELTKRCLDSIAHPELSPGPPQGPAIVLQSKKRGGLFPQGGGPRPKILGSDSKGYFLWYDANDLLAAMVKRGIVKATQVDGGMKFEVTA